MAVNNTSTISDVLLSHCLFSRPSSIIFIAFNITTIVLLLPLCIFILRHGLQQWRTSSSAAAISHSDSFTYHMMIMELIRVLGSALCCFIYEDNYIILVVALFRLSFTWHGEMYFHVLTCVERYLAVVHPIIYLSLRKERGVRIRNISIGCVWLLCFAMMFLLTLQSVFHMMGFFLLMLSFAAISFCSLSVLCVLIRSGPGEQSGERKSVDQSKLRVFYTIVAILGVLLFKSTWGMTWAVLNLWEGWSNCLMIAFDYWVNLPSSLMLPLLFLHRRGRSM